MEHADDSYERCINVRGLDLAVSIAASGEHSGEVFKNFENELCVVYRDTVAVRNVIKRYKNNDLVVDPEVFEDAYSELISALPDWCKHDCNNSR